MDDHPKRTSLAALIQQAALDPRDPAALAALARALRRHGFSGAPPEPTRRSDDVFIRDLGGDLVSLSGNILCCDYANHISLDRAGAERGHTLCVARDREHAREILDWVSAQIQAGAVVIDLRDAPTRAEGARAWPHP